MKITTDEEWLRMALGLMESVSREERTELIQHGHVNDQLTALAVMAHCSVLASNPNGLRLVIDTAFCLGAKAERLK